MSNTALSTCCPLCKWFVDNGMGGYCKKPDMCMGIQMFETTSIGQTEQEKVATPELEKYKRAFDLACREVASYSVCIWCYDNLDCNNCERLQETKAVINAERDYKTYVRDLYAQKGIYRGIEHAKGLIMDYCREFLHISDEETMQMARGERYKDEVEE